MSGVTAGDQETPPESAAAAGLRYVPDEAPGIRRRRAGRGFSYIGPDGAPIRDAAQLARIKALAIPPAWTDVWICPNPRGHLQATGRDAKGRKQYRYHPRWREVRDAVKYDRMLAFAEALPVIRRGVEAHLALPGLPREKVLATVVRLLEETRIRVGNEEYRRQNGSFGLTTLRDRHAKVTSATLSFHFKGKSGKEHHVKVSDRRIARIVRRCRDIPGQELFQYVDEEGQRHAVDSADVNDYLRELSGGDFTAKDFRTWAGTLLAARYFRTGAPHTPETTQAESQRLVNQTIEQVAAELGNTVAVCRKCYIHPAVVDAYLAGAFAAIDALQAPDAAQTTGDHEDHELSDEEQALLALLRSPSATGLATSGRAAA
jgi:DNA topoisomerase-1